PAVEEHQGVDSCFHLGEQIDSDDTGELGQKLAPQFWLIVHHFLGSNKFSRWASFDKVGREGERCSRETYQRKSFSELLLDQPNSVQDVWYVFFRRKSCETLDMLSILKGSLDNWSHTVYQFELY